MEENVESELRKSSENKRRTHNMYQDIHCLHLHFAIARIINCVRTLNTINRDRQLHVHVFTV